MTEANFWPVMMQVVPVLALALVLEYRVVANRFTKAKNYSKGKRRRYFSALTTLFCSVGLSFTSVCALLYLLTGKAPDGSEAVAAMTFLLCLFVLVINPLGDVAAFLTSDIDENIAVRIVRRRSIREWNIVSSEIERLKAQQRSAWLRMSVGLVSAHRTIRSLDGLHPATQEQERVEIANVRAEATDLIEVLEAELDSARQITELIEGIEAEHISAHFDNQIDAARHALPRDHLEQARERFSAHL